MIAFVSVVLMISYSAHGRPIPYNNLIKHYTNSKVGIIQEYMDKLGLNKEAVYEEFKLLKEDKDAEDYVYKAVQEDDIPYKFDDHTVKRRHNKMIIMGEESSVV
jgi:hypothetical protein